MWWLVVHVACTALSRALSVIVSALRLLLLLQPQPSGAAKARIQAERAGSHCRAQAPHPLHKEVWQRASTRSMTPAANCAVSGAHACPRWSTAAIVRHVTRTFVFLYGRRICARGSSPLQADVPGLSRAPPHTPGGALQPRVVCSNSMQFIQWPASAAPKRLSLRS